MRVLFLIFLIFSFKSAFGWSFEELDIFYEGCIEERQILTNSGEADWNRGENYEYCGCSTNGISKYFSPYEVVELYESQSIESNPTILKIAFDCIDKIGR